MPITMPLPGPEPFSIAPALSAFAQGQATKIALEDREREQSERIANAIARAADLADTPDKWTRLIDALEGTYQADLSEWRDFDQRDAALGLSMSPYERANIDIAQQRLDLDRAAASAPAAVTPRTPIGEISADFQNGLFGDPASPEAMQMRDRLIRSALAGDAVEPLIINNQIIDRTTGAVIGDYRDAPENTPIEVDGHLVDPTTFATLWSPPDEPALQLRPPTPEEMTRWNIPTDEVWAIDEATDNPVRLGAGQTINVGAEAQTTADAMRSELVGPEVELWGTFLKQEPVVAARAQDLEALQLLSEIAPAGPISGRLLQMIGPGWNTAADAMTAIISRLAPTFRVEGSGSTSDIEYQGMLNSLPMLTQSVEGRRAVVTLMQNKAALDLRRAEIVRQFQNEEIDEVTARNRLAEINRESIVTPEYRALVGIPEEAEPIAPPTATREQPEGPVQPGDIRTLDDGTTIRAVANGWEFPDGTVKRWNVETQQWVVVE